MNFKKCRMLFFCSILFFQYSHAQEKYSKVKIPIATPEVRQFAFNKLALDHYAEEDNSLIVVLNSTEMSRLAQSHYAYEVIVDDMVQHTINVNKHTVPDENVAPFQSTSCKKVASIIQTPVSFGTGGSLRLGAAAGNTGYYTYAEMITRMQNLATAYPSLVTLYSIGNSANGTPIYGVKISDNVTTDEAEPEVLYTALQHAREAIGGTSLIFFLQFMAENYGNDQRITQLLNNREIFIIPCVNPDGYAYNYSGVNSSYPSSGGGLWRKNRRNTGGGIGVDLNRNYSIDWGNCSGASTSCGSNNPNDETYYGTAAFSEPETQAIRNFVKGRHFVNAIDQHCFGPYYSLPYGRPSLHPVLNHVDSSYYSYVPALMGLYNGHRAGNSPETVAYEVAGGIKDWLLMGEIGSGTGPKGKIFGMTGEAGGGDFWAPVSQILQLCKENCFQNLQLAYAAGDYYDIEDKSDIDVNSLTGKFSFRLRRTGLGNNPVTVSLIPLSNINSAGASVTTTLSNYFDLYTDSVSYTLPSNFICGQQLKFAWKVESGGIITYDTVTKFYNPLTLLSDDMEGSFSTNWAATISPSGPAGWAFTTSSAFDGTHSMTESPSGNYTANSTRTVKYKNDFDLHDAVSAYLSFWVKHRAENFRDKLQVQISTDNSTWSPICGSGTVAEDNTGNGGTLGGQPALTGIRENWTRELFDLTDFSGNSSVWLRFRFTSDNDASSFAFEKDDGFLIDRLKVIKVSTVSTIAVKFGNFTAKLLQNNAVQLDWEAYTDNQHDHFEVERATDLHPGFISIARINSMPPYRSFDEHPETGNNHYRIKQIDKDGKITYSNIINIKISDKFSTVIYPNPVKKILTLKINSENPSEQGTIRITDATGRSVYQQAVTIATGGNEIKMNLEKLPPQLYFLQVTGSKKQMLMTDKFLKE